MSNKTHPHSLDAKTLQEALTRSEIQLYYQPVVDAINHRVIGLEALARWIRPDGMVQPGVFLPMASVLGLMPALDRHVLQLALHQSQAWKRQGFRGYVAVNLSMDSLTPDFARAAIDNVQQFPDAYVIIEVTESEQPISPDLIREALSLFIEAGLPVYFDDFGAGFSNMTYLLHYPANGIKIDRMFIQALGRGSVGPVLAMITLARAEGLAIVAEGVEQPIERERLIEMGCVTHQGFYYAKPMPKEKIVIQSNGEVEIR